MVENNTSATGNGGDEGSNLAGKFASSTPAGEVKRGRGRPSNKPAVDNSVVEKRLNDLFTPEQFVSLVEMPFDLGEAATGWDGWALEDNEAQILAVSAAATAKEFLKGASFDPKWIILSMFLMNFGKLFLSRAVAYKTYKRTMEKPLDSADKK